jgi:glycosyltransferase involved in cell wall biosynthesis
VTTGLVTVVIPAYNADLYVRQAVESCLAQTYGNIEVIVVDDGSVRPQAEFLSGVIDPRLTVVRQDNGGVAAARNHGARLGSGEFIAFLDADDYWLPGKLQIQVDLLRRSDTAVVFCDLRRLQGDTFLPASYLASFELPAGGHIFPGLVRRNFIPLSSAVVRRNVFESVGGFCEDRDIWEDWDLWLRLAQSHVISHADESLAVYRLHGSNASGDIEVLIGKALRTLDRLEQVEPCLLDAHASDLKDGRAHLLFNLGYARRRLGRVAEARQALWLAARMRPLHVGTVKELVRSYLHV